MTRKPLPEDFGITDLDIKNDRLFKELSRNGPTDNGRLKDFLKYSLITLAISWILCMGLSNYLKYFQRWFGSWMGFLFLLLLSFWPFAWHIYDFQKALKDHSKELDDLRLDQVKLAGLEDFENSLAGYNQEVEKESIRIREEERIRILQEKQQRNHELRKKASFWENLDGRSFEKHVASLLVAFGYTGVSLTPATKDAGIDIFAKDGTGCTVIFQCKAHRTPVGIGSTRDLLGTLTSFSAKADYAVMVSVSGFTDGATEFAEKNEIHTWSVLDLVSLANEVSYDKRLINLPVRDFK